MGRRRKRFKEQISLRLIYSPFLRLVLFNRWFRLAFLLIFGGSVFLALYLPKMWTLSPEGFLPVVKASGLDLTQALSLKRAAKEAEARKDYQGANYSWQAACVNNPADPEAVRGLLRNVVKIPAPDRRTIGVAYSQTGWLLRLEKTNALDIELCIGVFENFGWHELIVQSFASEVEKFTPGAEAPYLKALFHTGRVREFAERLEIAEGRLSDTELSFYKAAYLAGWGTGAESTDALEQLRDLVEKEPTPDPRVIRLYMMVCAQRTQVEGYRKSLARLTAVNEATVLDEIDYWNLLVATGRKEEAIKLARLHSRPPDSPVEVVQLSRMYHNLGLVEECRTVLEKHAVEHFFSAEVWATYASVLEDLEDWEQLRSIALEMRRQRGIEGYLDGFSYFLEGRSELAQKRVGTAEHAFEKAAEANYEQPALALMIARELNKHHFAGHARTILKRAESRLEGSADYWDAAFEAALQLRDPEWLLEAAKRGYELNPKDVRAVNRYAASLMVNRVRPEESIRLTLEMVTNFPESPTALINHGFALLLNGRTEEAREWLAGINPGGLSPVEASAYHLALFEVQFNLRNYDAAWRASDRIFTTQLFPNQLEWLEERRQEMPPRLSGVL